MDLARGERRASGSSWSVRTRDGIIELIPDARTTTPVVIPAFAGMTTGVNATVNRSTPGTRA